MTSLPAPPVATTPARYVDQVMPTIDVNLAQGGVVDPVPGTVAEHLTTSVPVLPPQLTAAAAKEAFIGHCFESAAVSRSAPMASCRGWWRSRTCSRLEPRTPSTGS